MSQSSKIYGDLQVEGLKSSDGSDGITDTIVFEDADAQVHTVAIKNGIITSWVTV
jgi:hypothetical protein